MTGEGRDQLKSIVEALLFSSDSPLSAPQISEAAGAGDARAVRDAIQTLNSEYEAQGRAFRIEALAGGFQMLTLPQYAEYVSKLKKAEAAARLSKAALETLAIIAYKQPVLRAEIEAIRGVEVDAIVRSLMEKGLVRIVGRKEIIGRPLMYGTTRRFLELFGLRSVEDLPKIEEISTA